MNKSISDVCNKYAINVDKIKLLSNYYIVFDEGKSYLLKNKNSSLKELFDYFDNINFNHYLRPLHGFDDHYEIYNYYDEVCSDEKKHNMLIESLSELHKKSMYNEENENFDKLYDSINNKINYLTNYYLDLQDYIERFSFPRLDYHYLIVNISSFNVLLNLAKKKLDDWYESSNHEIRKSIIVGCPTLDNFCSADYGYFINFDYYKKDYFIYDLVNVFKDKHSDNLYSLFNIYIEFNKLTDSELKLFDSLLCIPEKLEFSSNSYNNILCIKEALKYNNKIYEFFLEKNKEDQKTDKTKF